MIRLTTGLEYMYGLEEGMYILIRHGHVLSEKFWISQNRYFALVD